MRDDWLEFFKDGRRGMGPDTVRDQYDKYLSEAQELQQQLADVYGDGYGPKKLVAIRMNSTDVLDVVVAESLNDYTSEEIASEIKAAATMARTECNKKVAQHASPLTDVLNAFERDPHINL